MECFPPPKVLTQLYCYVTYYSAHYSVQLHNINWNFKSNVCNSIACFFSVKYIFCCTRLQTTQEQDDSLGTPNKNINDYDDDNNNNNYNKQQLFS